MNNNHDAKVKAAIERHGENFHFEFRGVGSSTWYRSPHLARPRDEAEALLTRFNVNGHRVEYRYVPWDGE